MSNMDRRTFLKGVGGTGVALSVAGCTSLVGGDGGGGTIIPGTEAGFRPFEFRNESGDLVGFDIDLLSAVVDETEYELGEWSDVQFDTLITSLQTDKIDVIAAAMTINEEREQSIDFSDPYYDANQAVLVRADGDFQPGSAEDLSGHRIGAQQGTTGESEAQSAVSEENYSGYGNYVLAVEDLVNGNTDAVIVDTPVAETFVQNRPVEIAFTIQTGEQYGFGVRTDDDDLQTALNEGLSAVRDNGTYGDLTQKWFASDDSQ